jgi:hypothetical protein
MPDMHSNPGSEWNDERALFDAFVASCASTETPLDFLEFAAWLDGRLDPTQAAQFEARLARDPLARQLLHETRCGDHIAPESVPEAPLQQLRDLLPTTLGSSLPFVAPHANARPHVWLMPTAAAAAIAIAILGFLAGQRASNDFEASEAQFLAAATFDVFQSSDTSSIDTLFIASNEMDLDQ